MADRVIYLDVDDEITSAATRIRSADSPRVAVVLPYGSRVATSRINFRLLSRDALAHDKRLAIVSGDSGTRALAASAGLPGVRFSGGVRDVGSERGGVGRRGSGGCRSGCGGDDRIRPGAASGRAPVASAGLVGAATASDAARSPRRRPPPTPPPPRRSSATRSGPASRSAPPAKRPACRPPIRLPMRPSRGPPRPAESRRLTHHACLRHRHPRPRRPHRPRRCVSAAAVGRDRRHAAAGPDRAARPDGRGRPDRDLGGSGWPRRAGHIGQRGCLGERDVPGDREAGRGNQGERHRPLRESRLPQFEHRAGGEHRGHQRAASGSGPTAR